MGVLFRNETDDEDEYEYDRSQTEYNSLFNEIIEIEPTLEGYIDHLRNIQPPQHREWKSLMPQIKSGNIFARNRLVEMYLRVVARIALYYHKKNNISLADAIQDGTVGLIRAIEKFDPTEQDLFSTYAPWWITQNITREMWLLDNPMYFPVHIRDKIFTVREMTSEHFCEECDSAYICQMLTKEISEKFECDEDYAQILYIRSSRFYSLEEAEDDRHFNADGELDRIIVENLYTERFREDILNIIKQWERMNKL
jgi:RNA polymerase primary sigma factor